MEVWLSHLSDEMKDTLRQLLFECLDAERGGQPVDPRKFPSQVTWMYCMMSWIGKTGISLLSDSLLGRTNSIHRAL